MTGTFRNPTIGSMNIPIPKSNFRFKFEYSIFGNWEYPLFRKIAELIYEKWYIKIQLRRSIYLHPFWAICIMILSFCQAEKSNKEKNYLAGFFLISLASEKKCELEIVARHETSLLVNSNPSKNLNCFDLSRYKIDSRIFNPELSEGIYSIEYEKNVSILWEDKKLSIPMPTLIFNTKTAILADQDGYRKNPRLYNYKEYRASLLNTDGMFTGVVGLSDQSVENALLSAIENCKKGIIQ